MNILVINGSPKGSNSITLQTVLYLSKRFPGHHFEILHAGAKIKALEKNFDSTLKALEKAELLLFSYPVYTFIAPFQLHRFVELLKESGVDLSGKFATQITTSKHFYDITAHRYLQENCQDLGLKCIRGLSADMDDLLKEQGQQDAERFFRYVLWNMEQDLYEPFPAPKTPGVHCPVTVPDSPEKKSGDVVIVTDCEPENKQLGDMIARFRAVFPKKTRIVNIREFPFRGGCLGCFNCAVSGKCIYTDRFDDYLRNEIQTADSIVYAFTVRDHSMGSRFKLYDDRQFCNGHRTVTIGMPVGYLVSGNLDVEENLKTILEARAQVGSNFLAGIASDQTDPDREIDRLSQSLAYALEHHYVPPQNFYGIGGMKVFRDLIWIMQGMMKADHKFYKAHGQYDFPQKQWPTMLKMYLVGALISSDKIKSRMGNAMNEGMLAPYKKVLDNMKK
ncbi:MAG: NAD(P)H-dependent oxidoreductase [Oscillospiraceae bacterium]|nr:NAD(P)H-dependent oxidoreductase [Oscillospiraceae bacterium]MBR2889691.1 NAD(P)H-dependent oxidoreductase [Oscillospiraceae bacterium]